MSLAWLTQAERSNTFSLRVIVWIGLRLGRTTAQLLLYPICTYYLLFSNKTRQASRQYLSKLLGRPAGWREIFRHYHTFAVALLDRVFVFAGQDHLFSVTPHGFAILEKLAEQRRGCILVGAHLGSFEILRALGKTHRQLPIKALSFQDNSPKITAIFKRLNTALAEDVIPMGRADALLGLDSFIDQGGMVGMMGDRCIQGDKRVNCRFLGDEAWFPNAPAVLASLFKVPLVLVICLYRGGTCYDLHFELLSDRVILPRHDRDAAMQHIMQQYAERLEYYCRLAPYNWFNFYDFWEKNE